tara:strand:+ start:9949 stop:10827 length:879 start_codon:yes stop_codon:yes gene_type:complete
MSQEIINEVYSAGTQAKNLGRKAQRAIKNVKTIILGMEDFAFATLAEAKSGSATLTGITAKNLVPFPNVVTIEASNIEPTIAQKPFDGDRIIRRGLSGVKYRIDVSENGYKALVSLFDAGYTRVFQVSEENEHACDIQIDGTVKGRSMVSFMVGDFMPATLEDNAYAEITLKFPEQVSDTIVVDYDATVLNGIDDIDVEIVSASATSIKFKAKTKGLAISEITGFETADLNVKDLTGSVHTATLVPYDTDNGVYEFTGTDFADGFTVGLDGVVTKGVYHFETPKRGTVSGIS